MSNEQELPDVQFDAGNLYRQESYTDRRVGTIRVMIPVKADGSDDSSRQTIYEGQTSLWTPAGTLPLNFELPGDSLEAALGEFDGAAQKAMDEAIKKLEEMRREAASSIMVPGQGGSGQGGMPGQGGGSIQMP